ncbi:MAG: mandelate racemase/muconate lactonizing enzyme family protein [Thermomicrobiales bacterium]
MRITRVEAIPLWASFVEALGGADQVPEELSSPAFGMQSTPLTGQGCVCVRIHTDEGLVGVGESMGRPGARGAAAHIEEVLAPLLIGQDPLAVEVHWAAMSRQLRFAPMTVSGVDIALWDLRGQVWGASIHQLLGGPYRTAVDVYASPIPFLPTPDASADWARRFLDDGFMAVKLKIGRGVGGDLEHVAAVRAAIGRGVPLLVDANGAYGVADSVLLARGLVREDVYWLEEPVAQEYPEALAEVRRRVDLPIASGEGLGSIHQFTALLDAGGADVVMPNVTRCGGITGFRRVAEAAAIRKRTVAPHGVGSGIGITASLHAIAATENFLIYEYNQLFNPLRHAILSAPLDFAGGRLTVPTTPGLGTAVDEAALKRFRARSGVADVGMDLAAVRAAAG